MDGHAQWLEHRRIGRIEALGHREERLGPDRDEPGHGSLMRRGALEDYVGAEIDVAAVAALAAAAGRRRIDRRQRAGPDTVVAAAPVEDAASELVARHEPLLDDLCADRPFEIVVEVATADPNGQDLDEQLVAPRHRPLHSPISTVRIPRIKAACMPSCPIRTVSRAARADRPPAMARPARSPRPSPGRA